MNKTRQIEKRVNPKKLDLCVLFCMNIEHILLCALKDYMFSTFIIASNNVKYSLRFF